MSKLRLIYISLFSLFLTVGIISCRDDFYAPDPTIGDGFGDLTAQITFSSVSHHIANTRADGEAIGQITSLCVFIYKKEKAVNNESSDGEATSSYRLFRRVLASDLSDYEVIDNGNSNTPSDAQDEIDKNVTFDNSEEQTPTTKPFKIENIPFGRYQIYAVANMGDLSAYSDTDLATPENLKSIPLTWNEEDISANAQMFGYFTLKTEQKSNGFDAPELIINKKTTELHAWLKRAASKVTVAVDGSGLNEGVRVWIKSIQVKDIPEMCWLGKNNKASAHLIENGEVITVSDSEGKEQLDATNIVTKSHSYPATLNDAHLNTAPALFFYENMQGEGQNKAQAWTEGATSPRFPDGNNPESPGYKDNVRNGTYVEVIGYYQNDNPGEGKAPEGYIIYRFMLGKNTTTNYDAQRNYHFKLTLMLKNNAYDTDWHIVYDPEPEIFVKQPFYVSYLYNQQSVYDVKIVGGKLLKLEAVIPEDDVTRGSWHPIESDVTDQDISAARNTFPPGANEGGDVYWQGTVNKPGPWNGFLSLTQEPVSEEAADGYGIWPGDNKYGPEEKLTYSTNETHWKTYKQGERTYWDNGDYGPGDRDYEIENSAPGEYNCKIPLYTKARVMVSQTGYTGNNPYAAYNRASKVILKATFEEKNGDGSNKTAEITIDVIQGRRVMNPKAIWRKANSDKDFHVQLKILPHQTASSFEPLISDGPWRAVVSKGEEWIEIIPTDLSQLNPDGSISGSGDAYDKVNNKIDFKIKPKGTTINPRGGYVTVYYNNFTCVHTIFVRQGYDPVEFKSCPGVMWHTYNLRTGGYGDTEAIEAVDPEVEGSYFRYYNRQYPIDPRSNTIEWAFKNGLERQFIIAQSDISNTGITKKWEEIKLASPATEWGTFKVKGYEESCRLPEKVEWESILKDHNTIFGYGVLYADGATETLENTQLVYGAEPDDHERGLGMRGVIICDASDGNQIFLPLSTSGYGRFKQKSQYDVYNRLPANWGGVIQYANRYSWYPSTGDYNVSYKPLFYDLWEGEGTLYWAEPDGSQPYALDINFNTLDIVVGKADQDGLGLIWDKDKWMTPGTKYTDPSGSDAVHIRLVHDK